MPRARHAVALWVALVALSLGNWSCRSQKVVVEVPVTRVLTQSVVEQSTVVVPVERTVVVTEQETVQVVVTLTPTPIPTGGYVARASYGDASTANPILASDQASRTLSDLMFEGLFTVDPFTGEMLPNFAERWTVSNDGLTYTFTLREGLQWSDAQPITAQDLYFTYAALLSGELDTPNNKLVANVEELEILDDRTMAVTFREADCSNLESLQLGWLPAHVFTDDVTSYDYGALSKHAFNTAPSAVSGPFALKEWARGDHWTQVRNES